MRFLHTFQLYDFVDTLVSLSVAFVFGTLIGAERQYRQRSAGLRTNVLVAVGAAAFVDLADHLNGADGAVRVIAYVVSGIGFLGAGAIMKEGMNVRGLNTAATLWASAAVGSCAGADMVAQSAALTLGRCKRGIQQFADLPHRVILDCGGIELVCAELRPVRRSAQAQLDQLADGIRTARMPRFRPGIHRGGDPFRQLDCTDDLAVQAARRMRIFLVVVGH